MTFLRGLIHFSIYFGTVGILFYLLSNGEDLTDVEATLASIGFFALAVAVVGLAMPIFGWNLPKLPVDTIYYSSAILATVVLFVGNANDRAILDLRVSISEKRVELRELETRIVDQTTTLATRQQNIADLEGSVESARRILERPEAVDLIEREIEVALSLERETGLAQFWEQIDAVLADCSILEQRLELERATNPEAFGMVNTQQILDDALQITNGGLDKRFQSGADFPDLTDFPLTPEQLRYVSELMGNVAACTTLRTDHESISMEPAGYNRLFGLEALRRSSAYRRISGSQIGPEFDEETQIMMSLISEVRSAQELAARGPEALQSASNAIEETSAALANVERSATDVRSDIAELERDLEQLEDQPLIGLARWAKEQGEVTWPFLLIMMLGMKLARDPLFQK